MTEDFKLEAQNLRQKSDQLVDWFKPFHKEAEFTHFNQMILSVRKQIIQRIYSADELTHWDELVTQLRTQYRQLLLELLAQFEIWCQSFNDDPIIPATASVPGVDDLLRLNALYECQTDIRTKTQLSFKWSWFFGLSVISLGGMGLAYLAWLAIAPPRLQKQVHASVLRRLRAYDLCSSEELLRFSRTASLPDTLREIDTFLTLKQENWKSLPNPAASRPEQSPMRKRQLLAGQQYLKQQLQALSTEAV